MTAMQYETTNGGILSRGNRRSKLGPLVWILLASMGILWQEARTVRYPQPQATPVAWGTASDYNHTDQNINNSICNVGGEYTMEKYAQDTVAMMERILAPAEQYSRESGDVAASEGSSVSSYGLTMLSWQMLFGLQKQVEAVIDAGLDGDVYEFGAWRGGASIWMAHIVSCYERYRYCQNTSWSPKPWPKRHYWVWDSFDGFQPSQLQNNTVLESILLTNTRGKDFWKAPLEQVRASFEELLSKGFVDQYVHFVPGLFEDVVPTQFSSKRSIALLRLDGDLYSSTSVVLDHVYGAVQQGGHIIVDDYDWRPEKWVAQTITAKQSGEKRVQSFVANQPRPKVCREAVDEFRAKHNITTPITKKYVRPSWVKEEAEKGLG